MKTNTRFKTFTTGVLIQTLGLFVAAFSSYATDFADIAVSQTATVQGAATLNGGLTIKSDTDAYHVNTLKITSGGYGSLWWQPTAWDGSVAGRGVAFQISAYRWNDFGFFVAREGHDGERPSYLTEARFYHDIDANVTVIGHHSSATDPRWGHNATLNVEGSLAVDGAFSCASFSGPLTASANTTIYASQYGQTFKIVEDGWVGQWWSQPGKKGVSLHTGYDSYGGNDFGFYTAPNPDVNPTWHVGKPRFFHDIDNNRTTIGHDDAMTKPAGTATLNVEGTLAVTGMISGNGSGLLVSPQGDLSMGSFTSGPQP